jgi:electron transfer flavoprotein alpha subunit
MSFSYKVKHHFINAFRELFLYHHSSLEFRAKLFAAVIAANANAGDCEFNTVRSAGMVIYNDETRTASLEFTVKEYVKKVIEENDLNNDMLIEEILRDLKNMPRYAKKIDTTLLHAIVDCHHDEDTALYQKRIIELFERLRNEYNTVRLP